MSTPIKPPGSAPIHPPTELGDPVSEATESISGSAGQASAVDKTGSAEAAQAADPIAGIVEQLQNGELDAAAAIEKIIAQAMQNGGAHLLPPAERTKLERFLRDSLADDPALASLVKTLDS